MRYDQYQQLYQEAQALIARELERLSPRAGNNVDVRGSDISVQLQRPEEEQDEPTWQYIIYGTIEDLENPYFYGPAFAAVVPRGGPEAGRPVNEPLFVGNTQVVSLPVPPPPFLSRKKITYFITTLPGDVPVTDFAAGQYRGGLLLILDLFRQNSESDTPVVVQQFRLSVGVFGGEITISPPEPDNFYFLRVSGVERL